MPTPRIVSLVPSATETVFRLGLGGALVGRSHVCDWPEEARLRPALTRPRLESTASREIHDELRSHLAAGLAIYEIDLEALRALAPTHLLVQDQCSVCAVSPSDLETALAEWLGQKPTLVRVAPHQLADVWSDIQRIGDALGCSERAKSLCLELTDRITDLVERIGAPPLRPRVACVEWLDPIMIAGHWVPELVRLAGGEPVLATMGGASNTVELETLLQARPDLIFIECCGFNLEESKAQWAEQKALRETLCDWLSEQKHLHGAETGAGAGELPAPRIVLTDGDAFFNRPGPRLVESAEILADALWHGTRLNQPTPEAPNTPNIPNRDWIYAPGSADAQPESALFRASPPRSVEP